MKKLLSILLAALLLLTPAVTALADEPADAFDPAAEIADIVAYYRDNPELTSWWEVAVLTAVGEDVTAEPYTLPEMTADALVSATQYAAQAYFYAAIGEDPRNVYDGIDLLGELSALQTQEGGFGLVNDTIYATLALTAFDEPFAFAGAMYALVWAQNDDGGFSWDGESDSDPDTTAMALSALALYSDDEDVAAAIEAALDYLAGMQLENGGFESYGADNSNTLAVAIAALVDLGEDAAEWNGAAESLLRFKLEDGSYLYTEDDDEANSFATFQALYALDAINAGESMWLRLAEGFGPEPLPVVYQDQASVSPEYIVYVLDAYEYGIMMGDGVNFRPLDNLTRAEFAKIILVSMGFLPSDELDDPGFDDVAESAWYYNYVSLLCEYAVIPGAEDGLFRPDDAIEIADAVGIFYYLCSFVENAVDIDFESLIELYDAMGAIEDEFMTREQAAWLAVSISDVMSASEAGE